MCLTIDRLKHKLWKRNQSFYECEIAKTPIRVYKILDLNTCGHLQTPYMRKRLFPKDLRDGLQVREKEFRELSIDTIQYGIHAHMNYKRAEKAVVNMLGVYTPILIQMYIPKGTKIWYGTNEDIVAQKICFRASDKRRFKNMV